MFSKFFFTAAIFTLALSAFSSESTSAGRYRVEGPSNSGGSGGVAGRYRSGNNYAVSSSSHGGGWADSSQSRVAGRYNTSDSGYAVTRSYNDAPYAADVRTQRAPAESVSDKPGNRATQPDHK